MHKLARKLHHNQKGNIGLGKASILFAFLIIASTFAYVVLSAAMFSSHKVNAYASSGVEIDKCVVEFEGIDEALIEMQPIRYYR